MKLFAAWKKVREITDEELHKYVTEGVGNRRIVKWGMRWLCSRDHKDIGTTYFFFSF